MHKDWTFCAIGNPHSVVHCYVKLNIAEFHGVLEILNSLGFKVKHIINNYMGKLFVFISIFLFFKKISV